MAVSERKLSGPNANKHLSVCLPAADVGMPLYSPKAPELIAVY